MASDLEVAALNSQPTTPFDSVENAHQYLQLLVEAVVAARKEIEADVTVAARSPSERRLQALRLVQFKLDKLEQYLRGSSLILNDLRSLRRLLLEERYQPVAVNQNFPSEP